MGKKNGSLLTRSQLSEAAKEVQGQLELTEDDGVTPALDPKAKKDDLQATLVEAGAQIDPQEDEFSEETWGVLEQIGAAHRPAQEYVPQRGETKEQTGEETTAEKTPEQDAEGTAEQGGEEQTEEPQEGNVTDTSASEDTVGAGQEPEAGQESEVKNENIHVENEEQTTKPAKSSGGKKDGPKKVGVISAIVEIIEQAGKNGITKQQILEKLQERFPDRDVKSMKNTVNVQVPNRISKEKCKLAKTEDGHFYKE